MISARHPRGFSPRNTVGTNVDFTVSRGLRTHLPILIRSQESQGDIKWRATEELGASTGYLLSSPSNYSNATTLLSLARARFIGASRYLRCVTFLSVSPFSSYERRKRSRQDPQRLSWLTSWYFTRVSRYQIMQKIIKLNYFIIPIIYYTLTVLLSHNNLNILCRKIIL